MVNMRVVASGRAHEFDLPGGVLESDLIFVKNPTDIGGGSFNRQVVTVPDDFDDRTITFFEPSSFRIVQGTDKVSFWGEDVLAYMPMLDGEYGQFVLQRYDGWQVEMDYFVVRKTSIIMDDPSRYRNDLNYGLRVLTSAGEVSFDSRALVTNHTFDIVSYLPPLDSNLVGTGTSQYTLGLGTDEYVNIEWTRTNTNNSFFYGLGLFMGGMATAYDADLGYTGQGDEKLVQYPTGGLIGAKLNLNGSGVYTPIDNDDSNVEPVDSDDSNSTITGSLTYQSGSAITEGESITFNATTSSDAGAYHVRVFQTSGSGNDLISDRASFFGNTASLTFTTSVPSSSRAVQYARSTNYIGTYSRTRISSYTRGRQSTFTKDFFGTYTGNFVGDFLGNYERVRTVGNSYLGEYSGEYSGTYTRTRPADYLRTRNSSYTRDFSGEYTRTRNASYEGIYSRLTETPYTRDSIDYFTGDYSRDSVVQNASYYSRYMEIEPGEFEEIPFASFPSTTNFTRTRLAAYSRTRIANRSSSYSRTFIGNYVGNFEGNYSRTRVTNYTGDFERTRITNYLGNFIGEYGRTLTYLGNYSRSFSADPSASTFNYSRGFARNFAGDYARTLDYIGDFIGNYVNAAVEYTRNRIAIRYSSYTRTRTKLSTYTRDFIGNYAANASTRVLSFVGNFARGFARNYTRSPTYEGTYTGDFAGNFAADGFTRNFIGNYVADYSRTSSAYSYVASNTFWSQREVYDGDSGSYIQEIDVKYQGSTKVIGHRAYFSTPNKLQGFDGKWYYRGTYSEDASGRSYYKVGQSTSSSTPPSGTTTNYSRTRVSTRTSIFTTGASYTRDFTNNFAGNYSRTLAYSRNFSRGYTTAFTRTSTYASTRSSVIPGTGSDPDIYITLPHAGYSRTRPSSYSRTIYYGGNYNQGFTGDFIGNYTRGVDYTKNYTRGSARTFYYTRNFIGIRQSIYSRTLSYSAPIRQSTYTRDRTKESSYSRDRATIYTGNFEGNYATTFTGNFEGNYSRTRITQGYTRDSIVNYSRNFSTEFVGNYNRGFVGDYVGNFAGNFVGNYGRNYIGNFIGEYTRDIGSSYAGNYSRDFIGNYTGDYAGNFTRDFGGNYSRDFVGNYTGAYEGTYNRTSTTSDGFTGNYERTRITDYTRDSARTRVSTYTDSYGATYDRGFVGQYTGNYIGNYSRTSTVTQQDSEIGWQGETFVAELRLGAGNTAMSAPRGSTDSPLLASKSFTLYDNDLGTVLTSTQNLIHHSETSHTITFDLNTQGDQMVSGRIYNSSMVMLSEFWIQNSNGVHNVSVPDVPAEGQSKQYTLALYSGEVWLNSGEYTVTKISSASTDQTTTYTPTYNQTYTAPPPQTFTGFTTTFAPEIAH
jgi:hypothetical protein